MAGAGQGMLIYVLPVPYLSLALVVMRQQLTDSPRHAVERLAMGRQHQVGVKLGEQVETQWLG